MIVRFYSIPLILILICFSIPGYAADVTAAPEEPQGTISSSPRIEFEAPEYNVGEVWEGEKASHVFPFKNTGDAELVIEKVRTSCGCTAALVSKKNIKPGESGEIEATFNTKRYRGKQGKNIYVATNDPDNRNVKLRLEVTVKTAGHFQPRYLRFGRVLRGEEATGTITFIPDIPGLKVTGVSAHPDIFSAELNAAAEGDDGEPVKYPIRVTLSPQAAIGRHNGSLEITTDHPKAGKLQARMMGEVTGLIKTAPRMLFFNKKNQEKRDEKTITVDYQGEGKIAIPSVESTAKEFSAGITPSEPGRKYEIKVGLKEGTAPGRYRGEIVITTDLAGEEKVTVPLRSNDR